MIGSNNFILSKGTENLRDYSVPPMVNDEAKLTNEGKF